MSVANLSISPSPSDAEVAAIVAAVAAVSMAIEASDVMPGVSSSVINSIACFASAIAAFALSASAPIVTRIFVPASFS